MRFVTVAFSLAISATVVAHAPDKKFSQQEYVTTWSGIAVEHMQVYKIPASITLAQGILESGNGNSVLAKEANNHFGIKCHDWSGEKIYVDDDIKNECFRKYSTGDDSYKDHSLFLKGKSRYARLFALPITDYKAWASGLKEAGYATSSSYPAQIVEIIERLHLNDYDGVEVVPVGSEMLANELEKRVEKEMSAMAYQKHSVKQHKNKINYIVARKGDTYYKISKEFEMGMWQLYKYNDFGPKKDLLVEGDIVYLQPKRRRAKEKHAVYVADKKTTITDVSQLEGIKLESLMELNDILSEDEIIQKGQKIILR